MLKPVFLSGSNTIGVDDSGNPFVSMKDYVFTITPKLIQMMDEDGETIFMLNREKEEVLADLASIREVEVAKSKNYFAATIQLSEAPTDWFDVIIDKEAREIRISSHGDNSAKFPL